MKCNGYCASLALFAMALPLMTTPLSSQQRGSVENSSGTEGAFEPEPPSNQNVNDTCAPLAIPGAAAAMKTTAACMSQAAVHNQTQLRFYTVTREYDLFGQKRDRTRSRVIATVTFRPPDSKNYRVQGIEGSVIGETLVRRVLEREAALAKDGGASRISEDNYDFRFLGETVADGRRCLVLGLIPKRKDNDLLRGTIWVDADTYLIRRTEGEPQKSPSWWLRDVHVVFLYTDVGGMWLPTSSEFTAKVRLFGVSTMLAHDLGYSYAHLAGAGDDPADTRYSTAHNWEVGLSRLPPKTQQGGVSCR